MPKIKDFFFAGVIAGIISGICLDILVYLFRLTGIKTTSPWDDMTALLFMPPAVYTWQAKLIGIFASVAVSVINGILISLILTLTGKEYGYAKSTIISVGSGYFGFIILYPALGYTAVQQSWATVYLATCALFLYGLFITYLLNKILVFDKEEDTVKPTYIILETNKPGIIERIRKRIKS